MPPSNFNTSLKIGACVKKFATVGMRDAQPRTDKINPNA